MGPETEIRIKPGQPLNLTCTGTGYPKPTLIWLKDGQTFIDNVPTAAAYKYLIIPPGTLFNSAKFTCKATNSKGIVETAHVDVIVESKS